MPIINSLLIRFFLKYVLNSLSFFTITICVFEFLAIKFANFIKSKFENFISDTDEKKVYPESCNHCNFCIWQQECLKIWEGDNYINQVASTNKSQIIKLKKEGIDTVEKLAKTNTKKIRF